MRKTLIGAAAVSTAVFLGAAAPADAATIELRSTALSVDVAGGQAPLSDTSTALSGKYAQSLVDSAGSPGAFQTQAGALQDIEIVSDSTGFVFAEPSVNSITGQAFIEAIGAEAGGSAFAGSSSSTLLVEFTVAEGFVANYTLLGQLVYQSTFSNTGTNGAEVFFRDGNGVDLFAESDFTAAADGITSFSDAANLAAGNYTVGFNTQLNVDGTLAPQGRADAVVSLSFLVQSTPIPSPTAVLGGGALLSVMPLRRRR